MIHEKGKISGFKEEMEMMNCGISCKEFFVKGVILGFGGG